MICKERIWLRTTEYEGQRSACRDEEREVGQAYNHEP